MHIMHFVDMLPVFKFCETLYIRTGYIWHILDNKGDNSGTYINLKMNFLFFLFLA